LFGSKEFMMDASRLPSEEKPPASPDPARLDPGVERAFADDEDQSPWPDEMDQVLALAGSIDETAPPPPGPPLHLIVPCPVPAGYEPLELLGRGPAGVVFKARHLGPGRVVVILMLSGTDLDTEDRIRFRLEAEAASRLQHPNLVAIYEVGEQAGCPFLVFEQVEGDSLAEALAGGKWEYKGRKAQQRAVQLIVELARALHVAHQVGVVHRDVRPANVLLSKTGAAKLGNFALGRRRGSPPVLSTHAAPGQGEGTPPVVAYLAPEQVEGHIERVGPAADVYGLGAILYELLTGQPAIASTTAEEALRRVRTDKPVPPRKLGLPISRDLQAICLRCLQKDPGRRYATAEALADDLVRWQQGEPVLSRPAGFWQRSGKWIVRRPFAAAVGLIVVLDLIGLIGSGWWYSLQLANQLDEARQQLPRSNLLEREQHDRQQPPDKQESLPPPRPLIPPSPKDHGQERFVLDRQRQEMQKQQQDLARLRSEAQTERDLAGKQRQEAQRQLKLAQAERQQVQKQLEDAAKQRDDARKESDQVRVRLRQTRAALDQLVASLAESGRALADTERHRLAEVLRSYQTILKGSGDDMGSLAWSRVGDLQRLLGNLKEAASAYRQALTGLPAAPTTPEARAELADLRDHLAAVLAELGEPAEAERTAQQAAEVGQSLSDAASRGKQADRLSRLGDLQRQRGHFKEADSSYRRSLALRQQLVKEQPTDLTQQGQLAQVQMALGKLYAEQGRRPEAEDTFHRAAEVLSTLVKAAPAARKPRQALATCTTSLAALQRERKDFAGAEQTARDAVGQWKRLVQDYPDTAACREGLAGAYNQLGRALASKAPDEAEQCFRQAEALCRKLLLEVPRSVAGRNQLGEALHNRAGLLASRSELKEACGLLHEAVTQQEAALEVDPSSLACRRSLRNHQSWLAEAGLRLGDPAAASDAAVHMAAVFPDRWQDSFQAASILARCLALSQKAGQAKAAEGYASAALRLLRQALAHGLDRGRLGSEPALEALRTRPDFQTLQGRTGPDTLSPTKEGT
jgi:serine/threonine protein kinase